LPAGIDVAGLVLAGGRGSRMGGRDKGLLHDRGRPMAVRAAALLAPYCDVLVVSANRNLSRYARWADVVTADDHRGYLGPLAGIAAGFASVQTRWLLTCPCDVTGVPEQTPQRLLRALRLHGWADAAVLHDVDRLQPLVGAWRGRLGPRLLRHLAAGGRSVHGWLETLNVTVVHTHASVVNRNVAARTPDPASTPVGAIS
jgi:molybdopterin-guanine dinucleotide biosynthesis protein A